MSIRKQHNTSFPYGRIFQPACFRLGICDLLVSLHGVLHCAAKRLTEPLQVPFDLVFRVKFTAEFFLRVKKKKQHLLYVSRLYTHSHARTHARRARTLLKWLSAAFAITAAPQLFLSASLSPRVPSEPTDSDAWSDTGIISHSPPERHSCYATSPNGSKLKT